MTFAQLARFDRRRRHHASSTAAVSIHVRDLSQLFNSLDPSPFWDRDLDREAAAFIEEEFSEKLGAQTWNLYVHAHGDGTSLKDLQTALGNYYGRMASSARREIREHLRSGEWTLVAGVRVFVRPDGQVRALEARPAAPEESCAPARDQPPESD